MSKLENQKTEDTIKNMEDSLTACEAEEILTQKEESAEESIEQEESTQVEENNTKEASDKKGFKKKSKTDKKQDAR